jgi:nucleosome assembly protein 1-like 1
MGDSDKLMDVESGQKEACEEELPSDDEEGGKMTNNAVTKEMLKNPALLSALQGKLDSMAGTTSGYIESLPPAVKRRIKSLKKLQLETTKIEAKFYEEVHQLECKYHEHYTPLYEKRAQISKGTYEPTEAECDWPSEDEDEELADEIKDKVKLDGEKKDEEKKDDEPPPKGIPEFWLTIFKNVDMLQEMVQEHDEPVLAALTDVKVTFSDGSNQSSPMGFKLHFYFEPNEYFTNSELTKEYEMKCAPPEGDPFSFDGPEIYRCKGCAINWKQGKNLTVKTVKKKQKHKSKGNVRTITKQVKNDSFFNFFDPPPLPEDPEAEVDAETQELLTADFEIGHYIRERIIPRAVLFFTGEALEEDDYDEEEEEEGSDGEEGEDEEDDPDFDPSKVKGGENPQECKQQ